MAETEGDGRLSGPPSQNKVLVLAKASVTPRIAKKGQMRPVFAGELDTTLARQPPKRPTRRPQCEPHDLRPISITFHMDVDIE